MEKVNGVNHSMQLDVVSRRRSALSRLESQLKSGVKTTRDGVRVLSERDITRINSEILILKSRI